MKDNPVYLRIGTGYFKKVNRPHDILFDPLVGRMHSAGS